MLDMKFIRENLDQAEAALATRGGNISLARFRELDEQRRKLLTESETLKALKNSVSEEIAKVKDKSTVKDKIAEMKVVSTKIKGFDDELKTVEEEFGALLMTIPNLPHPTTPVGRSEDENVVVRSWGTLPNMAFEPKPHWDLAEDLDILDFERAAKITGARFCLSKGAGARLERALISFMLDLHTTEHGYTEVLPPFMVNRASMTGTGQLPKFEEDLFRLVDPEFFLIPTAEVPVTNIHRDEILKKSDLPICYTAYTPCFRREAGSYGKDTRGLIRQHQFNKVELVKFVHPDESQAELEKLTGHAEKVLQLLELPYRVMALCSGDIGFSACKTYDLEVWLPSQNTYREISSCSSFGDFQARRAGIRFREDEKSKPEYVHTLNGSGLAVGRTLVAILENYQQADGSIVIPAALRPYMGGMEKITK
ncbi:serine--tRNA ligase [Trichlorobacter lovleyi]|uniref:serine--tRNA ligase n=1 Tax=Trichlorobacter lovleyi TaxID=313985 RepID=UPI0022401F90|nr:serine--tRNA ligase [Trichlorobacter lovleyi]QOX80206.1 serine--tRNA ligase [Trichlorobacter lovleyi]